MPAPPAAEVEAAARGWSPPRWGRDSVRLIGRLAIRIQSPSATRPPYERSYRDLDLVAHGRARPALRRLLEREGYVRDKLLLMRSTAPSDWSMPRRTAAGAWTWSSTSWRCRPHQFELKDRLATDGPTLDLATCCSRSSRSGRRPKDLGDAVCLLADHPLAAVGRLVAAPDATGAPGPIDLVRIRSVLGADWGFCHTVERNLRAVAELWAQAPIRQPRTPSAAR